MKLAVEIDRSGGHSEMDNPLNWNLFSVTKYDQNVEFVNEEEEKKHISNY